MGRVRFCLRPMMLRLGNSSGVVVSIMRKKLQVCYSLSPPDPESRIAGREEDSPG